MYMKGTPPLSSNNIVSQGNLLQVIYWLSLGYFLCFVRFHMGSKRDIVLNIILFTFSVLCFYYIAFLLSANNIFLREKQPRLIIASLSFPYKLQKKDEDMVLLIGNNRCISIIQEDRIRTKTFIFCCFSSHYFCTSQCSSHCFINFHFSDY